jgi:hypothetical protein
LGENAYEVAAQGEQNDKGTQVSHRIPPSLFLLKAGWISTAHVKPMIVNRQANRRRKNLADRVMHQ